AASGPPEMSRTGLRSLTDSWWVEKSGRRRPAAGRSRRGRFRLGASATAGRTFHQSHPRRRAPRAMAEPDADFAYRRSVYGAGGGPWSRGAQPITGALFD